jgi:ATP-dependent exoDNAse (exonuclease V) beta subunit
VACTRARDPLVVSTHRKAAKASWRKEEQRPTSADLLAQACEEAPSMSALTPAPEWPALAPPRPAQPPLDHPQWSEQVRELRARTTRRSAVSASQFEGTGDGVLAPAPTDALGEPVDPGLAKDARDLELPPWHKGRYGTAIGRAVHAVLQTVDLATGAGLTDAVAAQVLAEGVTGYADVVTALVRSALGAEVIDRAAARPHWRETYVGTTVDGQVMEGVVDLLYRDDDGLVVVDYKTDAVPATAIPSRVEFYRPQMTVYATAIEAAAGEPVVRCVLLFLNAAGARAVEVPDLAAAVAAPPQALPRRGRTVRTARPPSQ